VKTHAHPHHQGNVSVRTLAPKSGTITFGTPRHTGIRLIRKLNRLYCCRLIVVAGLAQR